MVKRKSYRAKIRKVGKATLLEVPPAIINKLTLRPNDLVMLSVEAGELVVSRIARPHYTLDQLVKEARRDSDWRKARRVGRELI